MGGHSRLSLEAGGVGRGGGGRAKNTGQQGLYAKVYKTQSLTGSGFKV